MANELYAECDVCSCTFTLSEKIIGDRVCPICGERLSDYIIEFYNSESKKANQTNNSRVLLEIPCCGKTAFHTRTLIVYNDHIKMIKDSREIIFDEKYNDILRLRKSESKIFPNLMFLDLKNGETYKFSLNERLSPSGEYCRYGSPETMQLHKTLPDYINKLIADYGKDK